MKTTLFRPLLTLAAVLAVTTSMSGIVLADDNNNTTHLYVTGNDNRATLNQNGEGLFIGGFRGPDNRSATIEGNNNNLTVNQVSNANFDNTESGQVYVNQIGNNHNAFIEQIGGLDTTVLQQGVTGAQSPNSATLITHGDVNYVQVTQKNHVAAAQGNTANASSFGQSEQLVMDQDGSNLGTIIQGSDNGGKFDPASGHQTAVMNQIGINNGYISQYGTRNFAELDQTGNNAGSIIQRGNFHQAIISEVGLNNDVALGQGAPALHVAQIPH